MPNFKGVIMVFEALTKKDYQTFIDKGLIRPYEQKLLNHLRDEKIYFYKLIYPYTKIIKL